jgi:predicted CXXCH cytochrome family protein
MSADPWKVSKTVQSLSDSIRVSVNLKYKNSQGVSLKKLRVVEELSKDFEYVKGSSVFRGNFAADPKLKNDTMIWELGDTESNFIETLLFTYKKKQKDVFPSDIVRLEFIIDDRELTREFDPKVPVAGSFTIREACMKCHAELMNGLFKHGPVDAGYCIVCHSPHASAQRAVLKKPAWELCTTCHSEKATEVHVVVGKHRPSHPTRKVRDPMRPGKRLTCASCHEPHSADNMNYYTYGVKTRSEMCDLCHGKK